jgi:hypothetical protein
MFVIVCGDAHRRLRGWLPCDVPALVANREFEFQCVTPVTTHISMLDTKSWTSPRPAQPVSCKVCLLSCLTCVSARFFLALASDRSLGLDIVNVTTARGRERLKGFQAPPAVHDRNACVVFIRERAAELAALGQHASGVDRRTAAAPAASASAQPRRRPEQTNPGRCFEV